MQYAITSIIILLIYLNIYLPILFNTWSMMIIWRRRQCKDPQLNRLITVLKMLHLDDFRDLQTDLNALIALGQEYTANPRTNSALGKVGR